MLSHVTASKVVISHEPMQMRCFVKVPTGKLMVNGYEHIGIFTGFSIS
uniref:Uncharacterized protein n=1 Tax=Anguilla anguilla TaxID=7936 RepID=A0A0E9XJ95_ANGAN